MSRRVVLAGNNRAATLVLDLLLDELVPDDVLVIGPAAGGSATWQPSLAEHARPRGVASLEPEDVNSPDVVDLIAAHRGGLLLSVYYSQLFRPALLAAIDGP